MIFKEDFIENYLKNGANNPKFIMLHSTGGANPRAAHNYLKSNATGVSCHLLIKPDGTVIHFIPSSIIAHHAGEGKYLNYKDNFNSYSIGIEIVNATCAIKNKNGKWFDNYGYEIDNVIEIGGKNYHAYTEAQIDSVKTMCQHYIKKWNIPVCNIIGHNDYAPRRKPDDPGKHFPMVRLRGELN